MEEVINNFWIRCYLGSSQEHSIEDLVVSRAYRDLNRTIHGMKNIPADISKLQFSVLSKHLLESIRNLMNSDFNNSQEFDTLHELECNRLIQTFDDAYKDYNMHLYIGQAQKWINMSIKYFYALGERSHSFQAKNFEYFHIPIDNIIQDRLKQKGIIPLKNKWSRIEVYSEYISYQKQVRDIKPERIPLELEFELFNQ